MSEVDLYTKFKQAEVTHKDFIIAVQTDEKFVLFEPDCMLVSEFLAKRPIMVNRRWLMILSQAEMEKLKTAWGPILYIVIE